MLSQLMFVLHYYLWNWYAMQLCRVTHSLSHHTGRVNSVRWIKFNFEPEQEFISSSSDKTAALWKQNASGEFQVTAELTGVYHI